MSSPVQAARLRIGDRVRFSGTVRIVIELSGTVVRLADPGGTLTEVTLAELVNAGDFERVGVPPAASLPPASPLDGLRRGPRPISSGGPGRSWTPATGPGRWSCRHGRAFTGCSRPCSPGRHPAGSARTRRSLAARPDGPLSQLQVSAPGEVMEIARPRWTSWSAWTTGLKEAWS